MSNITIIFTMHLNVGKCNSKELYDIIEEVNPEIIFEEFDISRTEDEYYKNGHYKYQKECSVETTAIMNYLEKIKLHIFQLIHMIFHIFLQPCIKNICC
jgi:predicted RNA methylase